MKKIRRTRLLPRILLIVLSIVMCTPMVSVAAQPTVNLGTTSSYAILAGSGITNTGTTTINGDAGGDVGSDPTGTFTGQASVTMTGTVHLADAAAILAKSDLVIAYDDAAGRVPVTRIPTELGGTTLVPGVYDSADGTFQITGTLTLDAQGDPNGVFIFKTASTLITAPNSNVSLINSARYCRTFWQVGSSATLGTNSSFVGHIFAMASITANNGAAVQGQLLARNGAVTLDSNTITNGFCADVPTTATLNVIKHVVNDSGRTSTAADFNLHVKSGGVDVATSPKVGAEAPGTAYTLAAGTYAITEDPVAGYTATYTGDSDASGNITLVAGDNKTVTITNDDQPLAMATLNVIKHVVNDSGRTATAADFNLHVKSGGVDVATSPKVGAEAPGTAYTVPAGTYAITEDPVAGYVATYTGDSDASGNITLLAGDNKTVTITNDDQPPTMAILRVVKHVINDSGRTSTAANFNLHVKSGGVDVATSPKVGAEAPGTAYSLPAGTYAITEDPVAGYTATYSGDSDASGNITLAAGEDKTVTITNNDQPIAMATLNVIKHVVNDSGRTATAGNFNIHVKSGGVDVATSPKVGTEAPGTAYTVPAGTYAITEDPVAGYVATYTGDSDASGNITLVAGDNKTVTITNDDQPPTMAILRVVKHVINDSGRTATVGNFNLHVKSGGVDVATSPKAGAEAPGTAYSLPAGTYAITEDPVAGYTATYSGDSDASGNITLAAGDDKTVTITNNDQPLAMATLHVIKHVVNDSGRTATAGNFNIHVKSGGVEVANSPKAGAEAPGTAYTLPAGTYAITEDPIPGYIAVITGDSDAAGNITLAAGADKTITITNNDIPIPPSSVSSGSSSGSSSGGTAALQPPLINVTKIPNPLALTSGEGMVTYTYKVTNPGSVVLSGITLTDDKVSTLNYISGDINKDKKLQFGETWIYTATVKLTATTTNAVTAKGTGNGMTAFDVANATVVVSNTIAEVVYPPLINVTKIPKPLALISGEGTVVYKYKVTNPGVVPLRNVVVSDDKISLVNYVSGDLNGDKMLQPKETWTYSGKIKLNKTETNTVTAKGEANGMTAIDIAVATVIVTQPKVINTKVPHTIQGGAIPKTALPWYNLLLGGTALMSLGAVAWKYNKRHE